MDIETACKKLNNVNKSDINNNFIFFSKFITDGVKTKINNDKFIKILDILCDYADSFNYTNDSTINKFITCANNINKLSVFNTLFMYIGIIPERFDRCVITFLGLYYSELIDVIKNKTQPEIILVIDTYGKYFTPDGCTRNLFNPGRFVELNSIFADYYIALACLKNKKLFSIIYTDRTINYILSCGEEISLELLELLYIEGFLKNAALHITNTNTYYFTRNNVHLLNFIINKVLEYNEGGSSMESSSLFSHKNSFAFIMRALIAVVNYSSDINDIVLCNKKVNMQSITSVLDFIIHNASCVWDSLLTLDNTFSITSKYILSETQKSILNYGTELLLSHIEVPIDADVVNYLNKIGFIVADPERFGVN